MFNDTIAAIATAMTTSGIGIVRVSGGDANEVVNQIFVTKSGKELKEFSSHTIHYGFIQDGDKVIDEVMVAVMKAPNSYTKEDTVEIDCHGGIVVMKKILETVVKAGARVAEPGEFTKRAFLNGRIDLSSAEAVIDLINAKTEFSRESSLSQVQGSLQRKISALREMVLEQTAFIEAALDDPEHYTLDGYPERLDGKVDEMLEQINALIASAQNGVLLKEGIQTAIVGKPNAGKSSLLNLLVGKEKAIVTDIAGTTRDIIEESILLDGICLNVIDTAGIRSSEDVIEQIGVTKSKEMMEKADLVLYVVDASVPLDENDAEIMEALKKNGKPAIVLLNKSDLKAVVSAENLENACKKKVFSISAKEGIGLEALEKEIEEMFFGGKVSFNDEVFISNVRQKTALEAARDSLQLVKNSIADGMPEDFFSIDLLNAYESLGSITGESVGEDLINEIFDKFCMGK